MAGWSPPLSPRSQSCDSEKYWRGRCRSCGCEKGSVKSDRDSDTDGKWGEAKGGECISQEDVVGLTREIQDENEHFHRESIKAKIFTKYA